MPKVRQSRAKAVVAKVSTSSSTLAVSSEVVELKDLVRALLLDKKNQSSTSTSSPTPALVKAVEPNCVTCGGTHSYQNCPATSENVYRDNIQEYVSQAAAVNYNQGITGFRPPMVANQIRPPGFPPHQNNQNNFNRGNNFNQNRGGPGSKYAEPVPSKPVSKSANSNGQFDGHDVQNCDQGPSANSKLTKYRTRPTFGFPSKTPALISEPVVSPVSALMPNVKSSIPYPLRRDNERRRDQANEQIEKFYKIFKDISFEIIFMDALILMPKFASTLKALIGNKEKLSEMARTPMNEHCSAVILNKLPRKLGDPGKFLIPCEFPGMDECLALADLGASINIMPFSMWEALLLLELTSTCMTLELADHSVSKLIGIAKDVSFKVGVFHFPADFVVVDFETDPRVPLILGRCFLKTGRALIDVHKGELTLRIENEAITYNLDQTVRYSGSSRFLRCYHEWQSTPHDDPIVSTTSPTLTPFGDSDFLLFEEADAFLSLEDDPNSPKINPFYYDPERDILLLETILNSEPLPPLPNHEQYMPSFKKELKVCEAKTVKSSVDEPPEVELKDLPPHLEYVFLEGDNKFPVIIAKELGDQKKSALIKDYKPAVQHHRRVNPKIHDVIKKEVEKLLDAGFIYPISDSPWVSPVHCVPKKGDFTVVENEENELIPTRLVTGWRVCIDYSKLNEATSKDHFPFPFMDQMLERLAGNEFYCFLNGFSKYFQIPIDPRDQEKTTFTCPYRKFTYRRMPFGLCNAPGTFQRCMLAIFHDMVEKTMEVFMDDFSVFGNSFENCLSHLDKMLQRIEVDRAKVDVIAKLPHPTTIKGVRSFLGHAGFYWRFIQDFSKISRPMIYLLERNTLFIFSEDCIKAFQTLKKKLTEAPILIAPNWDLPFELMCDASDFAIGKHKTRWSGPFTIAKVFPYGTVELSQANRLNFKVNGHRVKHYFGRDVPQLDYPDYEVFRALSFSFTRASHPQFIFGIHQGRLRFLVFLSAYFVALRGDTQHLSMGDIGNGYSRNRQKPSQKRQNQTQSGKDQKRQSHSKPKVKSQSPRSTKVNPEKVKVNPDKAKAEK
nr:reverse transcriptase domain-containing protein [Tanacetum cinerariifolium]